MLRYELKLGNLGESIKQQAKHLGFQVPDEIENRPTLYMWLGFVYEGFHELSTTRNITGFGIVPISWYMINAYCNAYEITGDLRELFHKGIRAMDQVIIENNKSKSK